MTRINLDIYYKKFFKNNGEHEKFIEINRGHAISSKYYDVQFGKDTLIYRDKSHVLAIPIEHDVVEHALVIYLNHFFDNNECDICLSILQKKISSALNFLKVKYQFEF